MKLKLAPLFVVLVVSALSAQSNTFTGSWVGVSGDLPQAATLAVSLDNSVYSLKFTWSDGSSWRARGYLVKGTLVGGFAYSEADGGFFTIVFNGSNIFLNTYNTDLTKRTPKGITLRRA